MVTLPEFIQKVAAMRDAQKDFFHTHSGNALQRSKTLEAQVDRLLLEMIGRYVTQMSPLPGFAEMSEPGGNDD